MPLEILTFGCRLNAYESEVMRSRAEEAGLENAVIVNTCAVTAEAERQARQAIRKARKHNPNAKLIVTGCAAQVHPDEFAAMPEVDLVLGNEEKLHVSNWIAAQEEKIRVNDIMELKETASHMVASFDGHSRAFVQIQNGCDHRCTFCIIPYGRGNSRSVPVAEVVAQVRTLVENGYKEIVFTGVDISDYGNGLPGAPSLGSLVRRVLKSVPELPRLRLSSIDAVEVDDELWRCIAEEERLMPHLHLSLQAGDDMILKRMKRRHLRNDAIAFGNKARGLRPDMVFGADFITGFPTETEEMFENTLRLAEEMDLIYLHVFPYSARKGTPAARMPQVEKTVRKERGERLRQTGEKQLGRFLGNQVGKTASILMERNGMGRTEHFAPVYFEGGNADTGRLASARILGHEKNYLVA
ncbi:MAG: tRNA (N(6)-L-threonylcarbamoyladenosine(37)-C(2))-methylthiotransferase MtaB [Rickettsiales bacterium]